MFQFLFRAVGLIVLALALVAAILDLTRSIAASAIILTPVSASWQSVSARTMAAAEEQARSYLGGYLWDPVLLWVLSVPTWLLLWLVAMVLLWVGQRRGNPYGRFASR